MLEFSDVCCQREEATTDVVLSVRKKAAKPQRKQSLSVALAYLRLPVGDVETRRRWCH